MKYISNFSNESSMSQSEDVELVRMISHAEYQRVNES